MKCFFESWKQLCCSVRRQRTLGLFIMVQRRGCYAQWSCIFSKFWPFISIKCSSNALQSEYWLNHILIRMGLVRPVQQQPYHTLRKFCKQFVTLLMVNISKKIQHRVALSFWTIGYVNNIPIMQLTEIACNTLSRSYTPLIKTPTHLPKWQSKIGKISKLLH